MGSKGSPAERFWIKVDRSGDCWIWTGAALRLGYGRFRVDAHTVVQAHRYAYELAVGPIPVGMEVCHHCDNPPCVNPAHLFLGTHADNMADLKRKGRSLGRPGLTGATAPSAKLTADQVAEIRRRYATGGVRQQDLADQYGVHQTQISNIVLLKKWVEQAPASAGATS